MEIACPNIQRAKEERAGIKGRTSWNIPAGSPLIDD
jgi:hypothetical protein